MSSAHPAEEFRRLYQRQRRKIRLGQALMVFGIVLGLIHVIAHLAPPGQQPSGLVDLAVGYPAAALLIIIGAVLAGQKTN